MIDEITQTALDEMYPIDSGHLQHTKRPTHFTIPFSLDQDEHKEDADDVGDTQPWPSREIVELAKSFASSDFVEACRLTDFA